MEKLTRRTGVSRANIQKIESYCKLMEDIFKLVKEST